MVESARRDPLASPPLSLPFSLSIPLSASLSRARALSSSFSRHPLVLCPARCAWPTLSASTSHYARPQPLRGVVRSPTTLTAEWQQAQLRPPTWDPRGALFMLSPD